MRKHIINREDKRPIYVQIAENFINDINKGIFKKDTQLPSINRYSDEYSVGRDTIEKSYKELKRQGYVVSVPAKGYYVNGVETAKAYDEEFQQAEQSIYHVLTSANDLLKKYTGMQIVFPGYNTLGIIEGARKYCHATSMGFRVMENMDGPLSAGTVYFIFKESDLAKFLKKARLFRYRLGKDIGVISFIETDFKDLLDVAVITTDTTNIKRSGELFLDRHRIHLSDCFQLIRRGSL